jgi:hypothetical protein
MSPSAPPHPGFFAILVTGRAYATLLYLLLSLATGTLAFTFTVTGLSLSLGLAILLIGLPLGVLFLVGARMLSVAEVHLLRILVGGEESRAPALLPAGEGWAARLKALVSDGRTWTSLLYFLLLLPLGTAYFTLLIILLSAGLGLFLVPFAHFFHLAATFSTDLSGLAWTLAHPNLTAILCGLLGLALVPLTFHLALQLGRFQVWLARHLLVRV